MKTSATTPLPAPSTLLRELRSWLDGLASGFRAGRQYSAALDVDVATQIASEVGEGHRQAADTAHRAEVSDAEARRILEQVLADGHVTTAEIPALRTARRHIINSERATHDLTEQFKP